jgi:hypothetical protein
MDLNKQSSILIRLNENYHKYLYLKSIDNIEDEKERLNNSFK